MSGAALIWCPFPDEDAALAAIHVLLDERLIACGNVLPAMTSIFVWNGVKDTAREVGVLLKTGTGLLQTAIRRLTELHPYQDPAVLGWHCDAAAPATLAWLAEIPEKS
ncbi:divalent cation tolerance protein [Novosphingobium sp. CF614]|uniref:divalent-cation tolerance protein CutA n=1 Tax=Novosphingobium sp. CF614 TaxID=1884364 RepID=UPI0008E43656|nr:divalent-cation tolerance protein CutA [Novosphingobium sp. CF614]SFG23132.1 divalent cation tolerance protein [Novosphingobium sp. CF614]